MSFELIDSKVFMLGMSLDNSFKTSFGTFAIIPIILLEVHIRKNGKTEVGFGETSIVFPFTNYDAFDTFTALKGLQKITGDRKELLRGNETLTQRFPAASAAYNMAIDDACGKLENKNVINYYCHEIPPIIPKILESTSIDLPGKVMQSAEKIHIKGYVPKIKLGAGIKSDKDILSAMTRFGHKFAADFNAKYDLGEFYSIFDGLDNNICDNILFLEQPMKVELGTEALAKTNVFLKERNNDACIIADESFLTYENAFQCAETGVGLNYKIHRLGGLEIAKNIEQKLHDDGLKYRALLGGTFPTAIGRVYDQQAAVCLDSCTLPSDGMSPSDLWFDGDKHIIKNAFCYDENGNVVPLKGAGLGVTIDIDKIRKLIIDNPKDQFRRLRMNKDAPRLGVTLNDGCSYAAEYERLTGRNPNWNLS